MPERLCPDGTEWTGILVGDSDRRRAGRPAHQVAEQTEDHDRRHEQQRERPAIAAESLQQPPGDGPDAVAAHDSAPLGVAAARARNASSRFCDPPWARMSAGEPSARSLPYWMSPSRWQRSASSMTWPGTISVVPSAAIRPEYSPNCTRSRGPTPTVRPARRRCPGPWT